MPDSLKYRLHQTCLEQIGIQIATLEQAIQDAQTAASEDIKSSAGDKFETSREMMKAEIEKNNLQLAKALEMLKYLKQINPELAKAQVGFGSLVSTNEGRYYFSVALGKVLLDEQPYLALSMASPIGKALNAREAGESVVFMGRTIHIEGVE